MTSQNKDDNAVDQKQQPFLEHIVELRSRILRSLGFIAVLFLPIYYFAEPLFTWSRTANEPFAHRRWNDRDTGSVALLGAIQTRHLRGDFCRRAVPPASTLVVRVTWPVSPRKTFCLATTGLERGVILLRYGVQLLLVFPLCSPSLSNQPYGHQHDDRH